MVVEVDEVEEDALRYGMVVDRLDELEPDALFSFDFLGFSLDESCFLFDLDEAVVDDDDDDEPFIKLVEFEVADNSN